MGDGVNRIHEKIGAFRKKYYVNIFLRGTILTLSILAAYFLMAALLEYNLWLADWARLGIFITFFAVAAYCVFKYLRELSAGGCLNVALMKKRAPAL
ncbi:MAG: hypothetical protein HC859_05650 [Bacteroidia bacterium]|nr:hypothetical protein [Bacteroidia bacterium]